MHQNIKDGSLRKLWKIFIPLSISMFSTFAMLFADRLLLSRYSSDALTAATSGGTLSWMVTGMFVCISGMAGVFVAQYNGAKKYEELASPVWQMIYFGIFSTIVFWIISPIIINISYNNDLLSSGQSEFLKYNFYYAPFLIICTALNSFYIGQGKTNLIKWVGIIGNIINIGLDYILIFGVRNLLEPMGIKGAAIATGIGVIVQIIILGTDFLSKTNRREFKTDKKNFQIGIFSSCFKKGSASAIALFFELMGWSAYYIMISKTGPEQSLIASIEQSIFLFFLFFGQALEKGAASISGNLIGSKNISEIKILLRSGLKLAIIFGIVTILFLTLFSDTIVNTFINSEESLSHNYISNVSLKYIIKKFHILMPILGLYILTENIRYLITGILISAGDTLFTMIINTITIWIFMVFPTYYFMLEKGADIVFALIIFIAHSLITSGILFFRFFYGRFIKRL